MSDVLHDIFVNAVCYFFKAGLSTSYRCRMLKQLQKLFFSKSGQQKDKVPGALFTNKKHNPQKLAEDAKRSMKQGDKAFANGALEEAEQHYRHALSFDPDFADACNKLGLVLDKLERFGEAVEYYLKALSINPAHAAACLNLGNWHRTHGNADEQVWYYEKAISLKPDYYEAHNNLGSYFQAQNKLDEAIACFQKALTIKPDFVIAILNMAVCCQAKGNAEEKMVWLWRALATDPNCAAAHNMIGFAAFEKGELESAERHYRAALAIDPTLPGVQMNLGILLLAQGKYADGLEFYEARFKLYLKQILGYDSDYFPVTCRAPQWDGKNLAGKTILLWVEQGLGDNLMMIRYLPELIKMGCDKLVVNSRPELSRILRHLPYPVDVVETEETLRSGTYDYHCPMTSLPYLLSTRVETIPNQVPYIFVPEDMKRKWADRLASISGPKVGLVWAGNKALARDALRSVSFAAYEPFARISGIRFVSLQKGESGGQARHAGWLVQDCIEECGDFLDTAALVENLDLVISVDTSMAHLAGALGKPVWLLNRFESEWRWMMEREDSPWYPTMRIFRQPALHDWSSVIAKIVDALGEWAASRTDAEKTQTVAI